MQKKCLQCGKLFQKKPSHSLKAWLTRTKFCSKQCDNSFRATKVPWNKGTKGLQVAWNKGSKLHYKVWNKGLTYEISEERKVEMEKMRRDYWDNVTQENRKERGLKISTALIGKKKPKEIIEAVTGDKSKFWKGEQANYNSKHRWIQKHWNKIDICEDCGLKVLPNPKTRLKHATHWANISGNYLRDRTDWKELCPKCHYYFDKH